MIANRRPRPTSDDRELRLWKVGRALTITFAAAVLVAGGIFYGLVYLLDFQEIDTTKKLDAKTLFDLVKLSFGVVAGAGALVALVVAYRRQRVDEAGANREATRLHTERFSQAVDKLGSDSPAVRLGGVHALAGLADDAPNDNLRQTCIDVLCAYLRLPHTPDPGTAELENHHLYLALREVRHTILRLIGDHYRRPEGTHHSWQGCDLDLTGVTIDCHVDFSDARFTRGTVTFEGATFSGGTVSFNGAAFTRGTVSFSGATFSGGMVDFGFATFSGRTVLFADATISEGCSVSFGNAIISGGSAYFGGATISDGAVYFGDATIAGGTVYFGDATIAGGMVTFERATISDCIVFFGDATIAGGTVTFDHATISSDCTVTFRDATISGGTVTFRDATISGGTVTFDHATISSDGRVYFMRAAISSDTVSFNGTTISGGTLDFSDTTGPAPAGLLTAVGSPVPTTVVLSRAWAPIP
ncbi:pentapeptide repeat-containing protein [Streptomyces sp. SR27]|uniref:pentapeptide repeat-containing protein n=1 Tax=Streptomyces sp. SR27 TaxID=3076630 RepID=UPI00295ADEF7|nr:pentapeptide repeat-containing protein [Streptomyces sp. SR27]MDV9186816.1 pentapeptide repeat-containing protein [Streptomyces sp. SR27]